MLIIEHAYLHSRCDKCHKDYPLAGVVVCWFRHLCTTVCVVFLASIEGWRVNYIHAVFMLLPGVLLFFES